MSGILFVDKPQGPTSHRVVARVRRALGIKKVGHAGTLDPMASGLMTLGVGASTRLLTFLVGLDKTYRATIRLGQATVTDDAWGEPLGPAATAEALGAVSEAEIRGVLDHFVGNISQRPSAVSAIKVDGKRSYDLVRAGADVELAARPVTIHHITVDRVERIDDAWEIDCEVACSSGTYIRAIARDLGIALGLGGHLTALRRTRVGPWQVSDAVDPDIVSADHVRNAATVITDVLPSVSVDPPTAQGLAHGKRLSIGQLVEAPSDSPVAVLDQQGQLVAIVSGLPGPVRILVGIPERG